MIGQLSPGSPQRFHIAHASSKKEHSGTFPRAAPGYRASTVGKSPLPGVHSELASSRPVPKARDQEGSYFPTAKSRPFIREYAEEESCDGSFSLHSYAPHHSYMACMEGGGGEIGRASGTRKAVMLWEFTSVCQDVFHPKRSVMCDATRR